MHERLGDTARTAVQRLTAAMPLWDGFDRDGSTPSVSLGPSSGPQKA